MPLNYIPPTVVNGDIVVQLDREEVEKENAKWRCALIAYVIGELPGYNYMRYIDRTWMDIAVPDLYLHENGYYVIRFQTMEEMQHILYFGPLTLTIDLAFLSSGLQILTSVLNSFQKLPYGSVFLTYQ